MTEAAPAGVAPAVRSPWRRASEALGWIALTALLVPVAARATGWEAGPLALLVALMPWMTLACLAPLVLAALARSVPLALASVATFAVGVAWQVPLFTAADAGGENVLTVASVNMTFGGADAEAVVTLVEDHSINVLVAQEVTPESAEALQAAGLADLLPYSEVAAEPGVTGTGLWTHSPLTDAESLAGFTQDVTRAAYVSRAVRGGIDVAGVGLSVLAVHPAAPGPVDHTDWDSSMGSLAGYLADQSGPMLVVGDFNTTRDHRSFRDIEALGYVDAADQSGAGLQFTFPEGRGLWPFVAIDHVLVKDAPLVATRTWTTAIPGADHRALVVRYAAAG